MNWTPKKVLDEWEKTSNFNKKMAEMLAYRKGVIGLWRRRKNKQLKVLAERYGGKVRNLTNHYPTKPKKPYFYIFDKQQLVEAIER